MGGNRIKVKGNRYGISLEINLNAFDDVEEMTTELVEILSKGKKFYEGSSINIITQLELLNNRDMSKIKDILFDELKIKDCTFENLIEETKKVFSGIYEGRTKFIKRTVRSGQVIEYNGNIVIIGDVNPGAEVSAAGNILVFGKLRGEVHAGNNGNDKAIVVAFELQPKILKIANYITRAPEDGDKPQYPEVAKVRGGIIVLEPYIANKYI